MESDSTFDLASAASASRDGSDREFDRRDLVRQDGVGMLFLAGTFIRFVPGRDDAPRQFLQSGQSAECPHPLLGAFPVHQVGRLIAGRAGPAEDKQILTVARSQ